MSADSATCQCRCSSHQEHLDKLFADAPPLTSEQLNDLAVIIAPMIQQVTANRAAKATTACTSRSRTATSAAA